MKWTITLLVVIGMLGWTGCRNEDTAKQPTPDVEMKLKAPIEMEKWFTETRYAFDLADQAVSIIDEQLMKNDAGAARAYLLTVIEHFNQPNQLAARLKAELKLVEAKKRDLKDKPGVTPATYKNLCDLNAVLEKMIRLATVFPESKPDFQEKYDTLSKQFSSIVKLLEYQLPGSAYALRSRQSSENPEYRKDMRLLKNLPTPKPLNTPTPAPKDSVATPTPTEENGPAKIWYDESGHIHMGQKPPENVDAKIPDSAVSQGISSSKSGDVKEEATPDAEKTPAESSLIWTDADGNTHMGSKAPEGVSVKKAKEIPLMQIN